MRDDLLRRLRAGHDPEALAGLFERDQAAIYHFMRRRLGHLQDAEDATQDVFRSVIRSLPSLRDPKGYRGWLYQIALRVAQSRIHDRIAERRRAEALARTAVTAGADSMDASEDRRLRIKSAVDSLDEELRTVVLLRYEQGLSYEEIADATQRPLGTVSKRLYTAHQKLQQALAVLGFSLLAGTLEVSAYDAVPEALAGRLRQMALEAPASSATAWTLKAIAAVALGVLTILSVGLPLIRRSIGDPTLSSDPRGKGFLERKESVANSVPDARKSARESLRAAAPLAEPDPTIPVPARVRGRVIDRETRTPIRGAEVWLDPENRPAGVLPVRSRSEADGTFSLTAPPGDYRLDALAPGFVRFDMERQMEGYRVRCFEENDALGESNSRKIENSPRLQVTAGSETERTVELTLAAELQGVVVDRDGRPVAGAKVEFQMHRVEYNVPKPQGGFSEHSMSTTYEPDGITMRFDTDLQGRFSIFHLYPKGELVLSVTAAGFERLRQNVPLVQRRTEITLLLNRGSLYAGQIRTDGGQPIAGASVFLLGTGRGPGVEAFSTGSGGDFRAVDQPRGLKVLAVYATGFAPQLVNLGDQNPQQVRVTLTPMESAVTGLIADESGQPLEGVTVAVHKLELTSAGAHVQLGFMDQNGSGSMESDADVFSIFLPKNQRPAQTSSQGDGAFRLDGVLAPGSDVYLEFRKEGFGSLRVRASATRPLQVQLSPKEK